VVLDGLPRVLYVVNPAGAGVPAGAELTVDYGPGFWRALRFNQNVARQLSAGEPSASEALTNFRRTGHAAMSAAEGAGGAASWVGTGLDGLLTPEGEPWWSVNPADAWLAVEKAEEAPAEAEAGSQPDAEGTVELLDAEALLAWAEAQPDHRAAVRMDLEPPPPLPPPNSPPSQNPPPPPSPPPPNPPPDPPPPPPSRLSAGPQKNEKFTSEQNEAGGDTSPPRPSREPAPPGLAKREPTTADRAEAERQRQVRSRRRSAWHCVPGKEFVPLTAGSATALSSPGSGSWRKAQVL
jgi:hypothetical protein